MVVPRGADHDLLTAARPQDRGARDARCIGGDTGFGLHPAFAPLLPMWQAGTFGAVQAVGLPAPNRSHFEAMIDVEDADPGSSARVGWINRVVGLDAAADPETAVQVGSSLLPISLVGPAPAPSASRTSRASASPTLDTTAAARRALARPDVGARHLAARAPRCGPRWPPARAWTGWPASADTRCTPTRTRTDRCARRWPTRPP